MIRRLAFALLFLPAAPMATAACNCPDAGSPVLVSGETLARQPHFEICAGSRVECMHRDKADRCDVMWLIPSEPGTCRIAAQFPDGTTIEDVIEYGTDDAYPCRGTLRPVRDHVTRL